eukprot:13996855-Alexandrium_andersonii.AAC.1
MIRTAARFRPPTWRTSLLTGAQPASTVSRSSRPSWRARRFRGRLRPRTCSVGIPQSRGPSCSIRSASGSAQAA